MPDTFIEYMKSLTMKPFEYYSCFISYSHSDKSVARRLHDALQGRGIRCWLDEHQILPGDDLFDVVDRGIKMWDKVILLCSKASLTSWWVDNELEAAFNKEQQLMEKREKKVTALIPLDLDGYLFNDECRNSKAKQIKSRFVGDFTGWESDNAIFETGFDKLIKALTTDDMGRESPPASLI